MSFIIISLIILGIISLLYGASFYLSITQRNIEKLSAYECGLEPIGNARMKFDIIFYIVGILFIIFDLELIFLFPLATILFNMNNLFSFWIVMLFFIILTLGFLYEWFMGALNFIPSFD